MSPMPASSATVSICVPIVWLSLMGDANSRGKSAQCGSAARAIVIACGFRGPAHLTPGLAERYDTSSGFIDAGAGLSDALAQLAVRPRALSIDTPGPGGKFSFPRTRTEQAIVNAAHAFAQDASAYAAAFVAHGLAPTLREDVDA